MKSLEQIQRENERAAVEYSRKYLAALTAFRRLRAHEIIAIIRDNEAPRHEREAAITALCERAESQQLP